MSLLLSDLNYAQLNGVIELLESDVFTKIIAGLLKTEEEIILDKMAESGRATDADAGEIRGLRRIVTYHDLAFDLREEMKKRLDKGE